MTKLAATALLFLGLAGSAQAHSINAGRALSHAAALTVPSAKCPAGAPVQTITIINQAHARPFALAKIERAMVDQSIQLQAAWGTPCVQFAPGGWKVYLTFGPNQGSYYAHFIDPVTGVPWATVATSGTAYPSWSSAFSHELIEMLVDPTTTRSYTHNPSEGNLEVADPVEHRAYRLDGLWVSDFVLPAWYAGGTDGICETIGGGDPTIQCDGTPIAAADASGPYDQMRTLTGPWQEG